MTLGGPPPDQAVASHGDCPAESARSAITNRRTVTEDMWFEFLGQTGGGWADADMEDVARFGLYEKCVMGR